MLSADERRELAIRQRVLRQRYQGAVRFAPVLDGVARDSTSCVECGRLFEKAKSTSETVEGVAYAVPDDQLKADDVVRDRPYLVVTGGFPSGLHNYADQRRATEALEKLFAPYCDSRPEVRLSVEYGKDPRAKVILASREQEDRAAQALNGKDATEVFPWRGLLPLRGRGAAHFRGAAPPHARFGGVPRVQGSFLRRGPVGPRG